MNHVPKAVSSVKWIVIAGVIVGITACGKSNEAAKQPPVKETVFDDMIANKENAKQQTEQAMQQNKEKLEAAMKQAEAAGTQ